MAAKFGDFNDCEFYHDYLLLTLITGVLTLVQ